LNATKYFRLNKVKNMSSIKKRIADFWKMSFWNKIFGVVGVLGLIVGIIAFIPFILDYIQTTDIANNPIVVSPNSVNLGSGTWKNESILSLHNKTDKTYYQIWIKIIIDSNLVNPTDIHITCNTCQNLRIIEFNGNAISGDLFTILGRDMQGNKVAYIYVAELSSNQTKNLEFKNSYAGELQGTNILNISVKKFSNEPALFGKDSNGGAGFSFSPPEKFNQEGISIIKIK